MKFSGRLGAFALADLVSVLDQLEFQGTLRLRRGSQQALLVFDGDTLSFPLPQLPGKRKIRARLRGEKLLKRVCGWADAEFSTLPDRLPPPGTGQFRFRMAALSRLCSAKGQRSYLSFSGGLDAESLGELGAALADQRSTGVLLVDDGSRASSVFYHSGTPFRRVSSRHPRQRRGRLTVRWDGGLRCELVEHPERFRKIRQGWPSAA